jgi:hypothetical protein
LRRSVRSSSRHSWPEPGCLRQNLTIGRTISSRKSIWKTEVDTFFRAGSLKHPLPSAKESGIGISAHDRKTKQISHSAVCEKKGEIAKANADYKAALAIKRMRGAQAAAP